MSDDNVKAPSQVFRWFERMKNNYESSVQTVLQRFESFTSAQQERVDKATSAHISNLTLLHYEQSEQYKETAIHLKQEIEFYKEQVLQQHKTIEQLNSRYDAMMSCLLTDKRKDIDIKDIFVKEDFYQNSHVQNNANELKQTLVQTKEIEENHIPDNEIHCSAEQDSQLNDLTNSIFEQGLTHRNHDELEQAFTLFEQAAKQGHASAMGAMGRSYFLGEGTSEDQLLGLVWLIKAAKQKLPQAIARVEQFEVLQPELYHQALQHENIV